MAGGTLKGGGLNMPDTKTKKCAHPSCFCDAAEDSDFCSTFCEGKTSHPDIICNCGHADCKATAGAQAG